MRPVRRFLPLEWPLARILNAKGGSNDEHLFQAVLIPGRPESCAQSWGRWETLPAASQSWSACCFIDGAELSQKLIAVHDHPRQGRIKKRKVFH